MSHRSESESSGKESGTHSIESQPSHSDKLSELTESKGFSPERARSIYMSAVSLDDGRSGALSDHQTESMSEKDSIESLNEVFVDAPSGTQVQSTTQTPGSGIDLCGSSQASPSKMFKGFVSHESSDDDSPPASLLVSNYKGHAVIDPLLTEDVTISASAPQTSDIPKKQSSLKQLEANEILALPTNSSTTVRSLFMVTTIQIQLPPSTAEVVVSEMYTEEPVGSSNLPGAFSDSSSLDISSSSDMDDIKESPPSSSSKEIFPNDVKFAVNISEIVFHFDMPLARLLVIVANQFPPAPSDAMTEETTKALDNKLCYSIRLQRCIVRFEEALRTRQRHFPTASSSFIQEAFSTTADDLLRFVVEGIELTTKGNKDEFLTQLLVTKLHLGFPNEKILSFDRDIKVRESVRDTLMPSGHDVSIRMVQIYSSVTQLDMNTAPLHINVDINRLAEVVNWLGGLSTVLDLGNSVKSNMTITESSVATKGKPRGAHFDATEGTLTERNTKPSPKINLRIGGLALDIRGREASVLIESSALKVVFRDGAVRLQVDRVHLFGPLLANQNVDPAVILSIDSLAITYFDLPKESDLTRLLALLSPSQDREEQDEDILLDTLLRQRRKGAVLRLGITKAKARVSQLHNLQYFGILGEELSQLSSVTKYLPEDDRPGLLILTALDNTQIEIDINQNIQAFSLSIKGTQSAMVTFPSLFLMSVSNINATHAAVELIGQATSDLRRSTTRQNLVTEETPRLSIRFIAGEMEPTVRLKLYDIRLEYHVTTIMAILGISETAGGEALVAEMVNTVANLATVENTMGQSLLFRPGEAAPKSQKPFRVDVSIRDVAIGLNPKDKPAQALLLLTKCRIVASHTGEQASNGYGSLNISKAYFMVTDDKENLLKVEEITDPNIVSGLGTQPTQIQCLEAIGYVSIGETSSAKITGHLKNSSAGSLLDVEVGDDLLVFETCADSTQTLLSILGGLAPPGPPCTGEKYRTEVIPINDMLASFSGEAFATDETEEDDTDYAGSSDDETGTIALDELNDPALDFDSENEFGDGPMSMESDVTHFGISSVILRQPDEDDIRNDPHLASFQEVAGTTSSLHFNEDHFGKAGQDRGKEWNSHKNTYDAANPAKIDASPLQIRFKDIHFIWNLYDGYDWQKTRDVISQAADVIETKAEERRAARRDKLRNIEDEESEAVIGDMLFNSIYIGISAKDDPRDLNRKVNRILDDDSSETGSYATTTTISAAPSRQGLPSMKKKRLRLGRSKHHKMTFELKGISGNIVSFPPDSGETQSSINLTVRDFEIFDNVPTSTWKKFATYMHDAGDRQLGSSMIQMEMLVVKPDKDLLASETVLKISVLPLRLHVDQDALDFLARFFEFRDDTLVKAPISTDIPFIQRAEVGPVRIKLDFKPKKVDWKALRSGRTAEFMNFIILDEADMVLRRIILYGVRGFDVLGRSLNDIWTPDVRKNQLPGVLAGLAPVRPLVNVGLGVRDLIVIPMREYKKDGRLVRAVRKGVVSFGRTTTTELAKLGAKLAVGTHTILSGAEGLLVPGGRSLSSRNEQPDRVRSEEQAGLSPYADQPIGVVQGLRGAYRGLERDLLLARDAIIAMPGEVMESDNTSGAAAAFLRSAPVVILRPAMGITKAVGQTLMGAANSLDKAERRRLEDVSRVFCRLNIAKFLNQKYKHR